MPAPSFQTTLTENHRHAQGSPVWLASAIARAAWTTDVIDKSFLRRSAVSFCRARVTAWRRAGPEVEALPRSPYRRSSVAASVRAFGPLGFQPATKRA